MDPIDRYLDDLAGRLRLAPVDARHFLAEVEDHLREATDQEVRTGADENLAQHEAIQRFGTARQVAAAANGSRLGQLGPLAVGLVWLGALGFGAVLVGSLVASGLAAATSTARVFGFPPGYQPPHARIAHWMAVQPGLSGWHAAAAAENAGDTLLLRGVAAAVGLTVCLLALRLLRRRPGAAPGGAVAATGVAVFGGAGLVLLAGAATNAYTEMEWGRGLWLSDGAAALLATVVCVVACLRASRTG